MDCDVLIIGAGAAGLFCAGTAQASGLRIIVVDHAREPGEKIRISGGGRCNFTNLATSHERFLSQNPRFPASALAGFRAQDFVALVDQAGIRWHEKTAGQLFCDGKATQITDMLIRRMAGADLWLETTLNGIEQYAGGFMVQSSRGMIRARKIVVASGGKSIPKMGATGLAYDLARKFSAGIVEPRPGLVPLTFSGKDLELCKSLAGISVEVIIRHGKTRFRDALLFTHRGLSGPAVLQISSFWRPGDLIEIDLAPDVEVVKILSDRRRQGGRVAVSTALRSLFPARLAEAISEDLGLGTARLADQNNRVFDEIAARIHRWQIQPVGSEGYRTAEVTIGGVDTRDLDAKTMALRSMPELYFIGECVDVTGWLGGYNFQWAWASGYAAGVSLTRGAG